jgi:hypothetical protein
MDSDAFPSCRQSLALVGAIETTIDGILRDGAQRGLQSAIEREVAEYIERNNEDQLDLPFF